MRSYTTRVPYIRRQLQSRFGVEARSRERINNDTINLAHFLSRSVSPLRSGFAPAERGEHEAIKKWGFASRGLVTTAPAHLSSFCRTLGSVRRNFRERHPWPNLPGPLRRANFLPLSLSFPRASRASLVEKFHCFCFLVASPAVINRPGRFSNTLPAETERNLPADTFRF